MAAKRIFRANFTGRKDAHIDALAIIASLNYSNGNGRAHHLWARRSRAGAKSDMNETNTSVALRAGALFWLIAAAITGLRIIILVLTDANLGPDEAQYWFWSREPAFGYFSKPPMIAWVIGLTTGVFGNEEWAVRLMAPLFHFGAAGFLFVLARRLYDETTAFWAGLGWLTIPGVILSSFVMTTDAPLLFFWSAGLYFFFDVLEKHSTQKETVTSVALLGLSIGLAFLSKYAALYFLAAAGTAIVLDKTVRDALLWKNAGLVFAVFAICALPNIFWNAQNDFQTVVHTAANANWGASLFKPLALASFLGAQIAVFGVIPFAALIWAIFAHRRNRPVFRSTGLTLLIFAVTPLIIVSIQSFISRAHANWAAAAYPAAIILVTHWLFQKRTAWAAKASVMLHCVLMIFFTLGVLNFSLVDQLGLSGAIRELRDWQSQTAEISNRASGFDAIMIDDRELMGEMLYYQRNSKTDIVAWDPNARIDNHYEAFKPFDPARHKRVLFVTTRSDDAHVNYRFRSITPLGAVSVEPGAEPGNDEDRRFHLFDVSDYFPPPG